MSTAESSAKKINDEKLSQYFDGELPADEASEVRAILDRDATAKQKLDGLEHLSGLIKLAAEDMAADLDGEDLFAKISAGVAEDEADGGRGLTSIAGGRKSGPGKPAHGEPWKLNIPIVIGLAAAAAILLVLWQQGDDSDFVRANHRGVDGDEGREVLVQIEDDQTAIHVEAPHGSEVEDVDFGDNTGTVFAVEGAAGEPIAVVWIDDQEEAMR